MGSDGQYGLWDSGLKYMRATHNIYKRDWLKHQSGDISTTGVAWFKAVYVYSNEGDLAKIQVERGAIRVVRHLAREPKFSYL